MTCEWTRMPTLVFARRSHHLGRASRDGFACACLSDQPALALERAVQAPALAPAVVELWPAIVFGLFGAALLVYSPVAARGRASPAVLQRFLF